ncbi:MAG: UDP-N-acetylglucosamine 2-epimerase (non-hydrolyzing) [Myxococcales bacterium]|nr:UDP-N-acetylglucosamine 2-epimerase (non-hydrolyzing) [Myxococcales bacterium]
MTTNDADSTLLRVAIVFGTRPEAIKLFPVYLALSSRVGSRAVRLICTDQHSELLEPVMGLFGDGRVEHLGGFEAGQPLSALTARITDRVGAALRACRPDLVVVQGDTVSSFAGALAAFYERIPLAHVEAGLRTHDLTQPYPEEFNRVALARLAQLHLAPTERAADNLREEGVAPKDVVVTGNTGQDAVRLIADNASWPGIDGIEPSAPFGIVTIHRRENAPNAAGIAAGIVEGARRSGLPVVVILHPNDAVSRPLRDALGATTGVVLVDPLPYPAMLGLLRRARFVLTDSGGVQEEAAALGVPVLVARQKTCRPEAVGTGNAVVVGHGPQAIARWFERLAADDALHAEMAVARPTYGDGFAAARVVEAIVQRFARQVGV